MSPERPLRRALGLALLVVAAWLAWPNLGTASPQEPAAPSDNTPADAPEPRPAVEEPLPPVSLTPEQEARARVLEGELRCPVCRSQSIRQSRSFMADDMRRRTRQMIAEGRSDEEVRQYFVDRYGTWVLLTPPKRGFNLAAYLLPGVVILVGAVGLALAARRRSRAAVEQESTKAPPPSPQLARLERELEEIE